MVLSRRIQYPAENQGSRLGTGDKVFKHLLSSTLPSSPPPFSSSPGFPPIEVRPSEAKATKFALPRRRVSHPLYMDSGRGFRESQARRVASRCRLLGERNSRRYCRSPEATARSLLENGYTDQSLLTQNRASSFAAVNTFFALGRNASSSVGAYGTGVSSEVTRISGPSIS